MDDREFNLSVRDHELRRVELRRARRGVTLTILVALTAAVLSNLVAVVLSNRSLQQATEQFDRNRRSEEYDEIVDGLTSASSAVQINSLRRLGRYVHDSGNFRAQSDQQTEAKTTVKTLAAFVKERASSTKDGLQRWATPQPPAVAAALDQLNDLVGDDDLKPGSFDVAQADLHGMTNLSKLRPHGGFMTGVDLRLAKLDELDLTLGQVNLRRAFLTCANLSGSRLGTADLEYADLSGADLRGADLSSVTHLTAAQLTGVTIDPGTRLPDGVALSASPPWDGDQCARYVSDMAGLRSGAGYDDDIPCPTTLAAYAAAGDSLPGAVSDTAIIEVCSARDA